MALILDESLVLGIAGLVFVPVFVFCIKMIMKVGTLEQKIDALCNNVSGLITEKKEVDRLKQQVNLIEYQVRELVGDVDYLMKRTDIGITRTRDRERREDRFRSHINTNEEKENENDIDHQRRGS